MSRLDRLFLKLFQEEEDLHFYCLVDCSPSMQFGEPSKQFYAKQLAAALGYVGLVRSDRVKIEPICSDFANVAPPLRGRSSLWRLMQQLQSWEPGPGLPLEESIKRFVLRNTNKGIVVVVTDLMNRSGYEQALKYLIARQFDIYLIHLLSPAEIDPDVSGDLRLVDCEDGRFTEVTVTNWMLDRYKNVLANFLQRAKEYCTRRSIVYLMTTTDRPLENVIGGYLRQRGLLR